ncbi:hypothetical protein GQX73_g2233 [Xylaria multiplex]|uniref:Uncharacterized protein n=1 Tax=Xylaria multiplex TaxID=323545 RepID=A0A7C8MTV1_9PEZI|nr:hypothetical protein GQX73_g2233 [Xylaria multiplex]
MAQIPNNDKTVAANANKSKAPTSSGFTSLSDGQGDVGDFEHYLAKKGKSIQVYVKIAEIDTGMRMDKSKTIGTITRKNCNDILMCAHSGYSTGVTGEDSCCLDTKKWNSLALHHLAKQIGFQFPGNIRDTAGGPMLDEYRGRAHAGHVEVLLAAWYVVDALRSKFQYANESEEWIIKQVKQLRHVDLGSDRRVANITIDSEPCLVCIKFLTKLSQHTGILFSVSEPKGIGPIQVRVGGGRRLDTVNEVFADSGDKSPPGGEAEEPHNSGIKILPVLTTSTPKTRVPRPATRRLGTEDLGKGLMMHCTGAAPANLKSASPIKYERLPLSQSPPDGRGGSSIFNDSPAQIHTAPSTDTAHADGINFARSAYRAVQDTVEIEEESEYEFIERPPKNEGLAGKQRRLNHKSSAPPYKTRRRSEEPCTNRLDGFRHKPLDESNNSVLKYRYAILRPGNRRLDPHMY